MARLARAGAEPVLRWLVIGAAAIALVVVLLSVDDAEARLGRLLGSLAALVGIAVLLTVAVGLAMLVVWTLRRESGTTVVPFDVSPNVPLVGSGLADGLVAALQRVGAIHSDNAPEAMQRIHVETELLSMPTVVPSQEPIRALLADVGTVTAGVAQLSVGRIILALRMLRRDAAAVLLRGSAQGDPTNVQVLARVERGDDVGIFTVDSPAAAVPDALDDLAYKVIVGGQLVPGAVAARNWQALKSFTEALASYRSYQRSGDPADLHAAREHCDAALRVERQYAKVFTVAYNVGIAYLEQGDNENARRSFEIARSASPHDPAPLIGLGTVYHRLGLYGLAIDLFREALTIAAPDDAGVRAAALAGLGNAWSDRGRLDEAMARFEEAAALCRRAGDTLGEAQNLSRLARRLADQGQTEDAVAASMSAVARLDGIDEPYAESQVLENHAGVLTDAGRLDEAQQYARQALDRAAVVPSPFMRAKANMNLARALVFAERFDDARLPAEAAAAARDTGFRHTALAILGLAALRTGDLRAAARAFKAAVSEADARLERDRGNAGALYSKALALDGWARVAERSGDQQADIDAITRRASEARARARELNAAPGVARRQQRFVEVLP